MSEEKTLSPVADGLDEEEDSSNADNNENVPTTDGLIEHADNVKLREKQHWPSDAQYHTSVKNEFQGVSHGQQIERPSQCQRIDRENRIQVSNNPEDEAIMDSLNDTSTFDKKNQEPTLNEIASASGKHYDCVENVPLKCQTECTSQPFQKIKDVIGKEPLNKYARLKMKESERNSKSNDTGNLMALHKVPNIFAKFGKKINAYQKLEGSSDSFPHITIGSGRSNSESRDDVEKGLITDTDGLITDTDGTVTPQDYCAQSSQVLDRSDKLDRFYSCDIPITRSKSVHVYLGTHESLAEGDHSINPGRPPAKSRSSCNVFHPFVTSQCEYVQQGEVVGAGGGAWTEDDSCSVDGSYMSDTDNNDICGSQGGSLLQRRDGAFSDTDTDSAVEDPRRNVPDLVTEKPKNSTHQEDHVVEKLAQVPPVMIYYEQMRREFHWHRLFLNHYECIDFSVFEFGRRREYLLWRLFCFLALIGIHIWTYFVEPKALQPFPVKGNNLCVHTWLGWLFLIQLSIEVPVLAVTYFLYPTCYLARIHGTPFCWKIVWVLNNVIPSNLYSATFMFAFVFSGHNDANPGEFGSFVHVILTTFCIANIMLGAVPIRVAHVIQPLLLSAAFIAYVNLVLPCSNQPTVVAKKGNKNNPEDLLQFEPCYLEPIMWNAGWITASIFITVWMLITLMSHLALVMMTWCRRLLLRGWRERSVPIYGRSPATHFINEVETEVSPYMLSMCERDGFNPRRFVQHYVDSPPYNTTNTAGLKRRKRCPRQETRI